MRLNTILSSLLIVASVAGCAQSSKKIDAAYVSPLAYEGLTCRQIEGEARRVSAKAAEVSGIQNKNATNDAVATGVAIVIFLPIAFLIRGNKEVAAQVSRLKGELTTLEQVSNSKNCGIVFQAAEAPSE